jgi:hypothetical protein
VAEVGRAVKPALRAIRSHRLSVFDSPHQKATVLTECLPKTASKNASNSSRQFIYQEIVARLFPQNRGNAIGGCNSVQYQTFVSDVSSDHSLKAVATCSLQVVKTSVAGRLA